MKISTKGRYGLRILIDLATHDPEKPRMLKDIAQSQQISEKYISRLVIDLRRAKLVRSVRGVNGGFHLAKLPEKITLLEVLETMEGPISVVDCVRSPEKVQTSDPVSGAQHLDGTQRRHPGAYLEDHPRRHSERLPQAGRRKRHLRLLHLKRRGGC